MFIALTTSSFSYLHMRIYCVRYSRSLLPGATSFTPEDDDTNNRVRGVGG
jgi:hypothetical protein